MRQRRVIAALGFALVAAGAAWWFAAQPPQPTARAAAPNHPVPAPQPTATPAAAAVPAAVRGPVAAGAGPPGGAVAAARKRLQERLDALAAAYEKGDWRAAERAMWPNHAVVRPDGEHLERNGIRETWHEEWLALQNRELRFYVEKFDVQGNVVAAEWTVLLTADLTDPGGEVHHMMINGVQAATLVGDGDAQRLDGAIVYTAFERTLNGNVWPTD